MGTVDFTYDSLDRIATREAADFFYTGQMLDPTTDGTNTWSRTPAGRLIAQDDGTNDRLIGLNRHGDQSWLFGTTGTVAASTVYDPFGVAAATTGGGGSPLGFQGDYTDPTFGEVWMGARWYSATDAGFRSRDVVLGELTTPVSLNRYTYAANSPLVYWDPTGRYAEYIEGLDGPTLGGQIAEVHDQTSRQTRYGDARQILQQPALDSNRALRTQAAKVVSAYEGSQEAIGVVAQRSTVQRPVHTEPRRVASAGFGRFLSPRHWNSVLWDTLTGPNAADYMDLVAAESAEAGVDPILALAILNQESNGRQRWGWKAQQFELAWAAVDLVRLRDTSIGLGQMQRNTFDATIRNHPDQFEELLDRHWEDMIFDEDLSIRALIWHMHDLQAVIDARPDLREGAAVDLSYNDLVAYGYNSGVQRLEDVLDGEKPDPYGGYVNTIRDRYQWAEGLYCQSKDWTCSP